MTGQTRPGSQQRAYRVEEIAAVTCITTRQVAAGMSTEACSSVGRRASSTRRLAGVAGQRQRALEDVARRQDSALVAQDAGAAAAVEHRDRTDALYSFVRYRLAIRSAAEQFSPRTARPSTLKHVDPDPTPRLT